MNQKGIVISGLVYALLVFFILLLVSLLAVLWYRQVAMDQLKITADNIYNVGTDNNPPIITMLGDNPVSIYMGQTYSDAGATAQDDVDGDLTANIVMTSNVNINTVGVYTVSYNVSDKEGHAANTVTRTVNVLPSVFTYSYTGSYQTFAAASAGTFQIELWGAQGGTNVSLNTYGGNGAYGVGKIMLNKGEIIYIYIGSAGAMQLATPLSATYNGGGGTSNNNSAVYGGSGGGATDVRLLSGNWNDVSSLRSRIMVAAGGGGGMYVNDSNYNFKNASGGYGGALIGGSGTYPTCSSSNPSTVATGGTQTAGGIGSNNNATYSGSFGIGGSSSSAASGAGGGYYGGGGGVDTGWTPASGAGGSSFISGCSGCNAINSSGAPTGQPNHYSGKVFTNTQMIPGNAAMPAPAGGTETGHAGDGYAKITFISG